MHNALPHTLQSMCTPPRSKRTIISLATHMITRKCSSIAILLVSLPNVACVVDGHGVVPQMFFTFSVTDSESSTGGSGGKRSKSASTSLNVRSSKSKPSGGSSSNGGEDPPLEQSCEPFFRGLKDGYDVWLERVLQEMMEL